MKTTLMIFGFSMMSMGMSGQAIFSLDSIANADTQAATATTGIYFSYDASGNQTSAYKSHLAYHIRRRQ